MKVNWEVGSWIQLDQQQSCFLNYQLGGWSWTGMGEGGRDGRSEGGKERGGATMWGRKDRGGKDGGAKDGGREKWKEGRMEGGREHYFLQLWVLAFNKFGSTKLLIL